MSLSIPENSPVSETPLAGARYGSAKPRPSRAVAEPNPRQSGRIFTTSLTSRRFPALRTLTAEDVEVMVMPPAASRALDHLTDALMFDVGVLWAPQTVGR